VSATRTPTGAGRAVPALFIRAWPGPPIPLGLRIPTGHGCRAGIPPPPRRGRGLGGGGDARHGEHSCRSRCRECIHGAGDRPREPPIPREKGHRRCWPAGQSPAPLGGIPRGREHTAGRPPRSGPKLPVAYLSYPHPADRYGDRRRCVHSLDCRRPLYSTLRSPSVEGARRGSPGGPAGAWFPALPRTRRTAIRCPPSIPSHRRRPTSRQKSSCA